ncbi:unnamed protein product, partial [Symbiodinium sp. CCMP2456]
ALSVLQDDLGDPQELPGAHRQGSPQDRRAPRGSLGAARGAQVTGRHRLHRGHHVLSRLLRASRVVVVPPDLHEPGGELGGLQQPNG